MRRLYPAVIPREKIMKVFPKRTWQQIQDKANKIELERGGPLGSIDVKVFENLKKVYKI